MRVEGPVDLASSLFGGQAFRWRREAGGAFVGAFGGAAWRLTDAPGGVRAQAWPPRPAQALAGYLDVSDEDAARRARLARDPVIAPALAAFPGLRLLRQDPWETTVAFITSANNNVLRIERILHAIARKWGARIDAPFDARAFPDAATLARARDASLRGAGLGYRAPFVRDAARMVARGDVDLEAVRGAAPDEAREVLLALPGVGPKVADCIALFSLDVTGAFPMDRWMLRAVSDACFGGASVTAREAETFARARWGPDAGLAQQYLFHAARTAAAAPGTARLRS